MGMILGAYLTKGGLDVTLIDAWKEHVDAMNRYGAHVIGKVDERVPVRAVTPDQAQGPYDLIFLMTKQTANRLVLPEIARLLAPDGTVCTLQNGVPDLAVAEVVGKSRTVGGIMMWSAAQAGPGTSSLSQDIFHNSVPCFEIGELDGQLTERIQTVSQVLRTMAETTVTDRLMDVRWFKVMVNSTISGMSTVLGITFYRALREEAFVPYSAMIAREAARVCAAAGYSMPEFHGKRPVEVLDFSDEAGLAACRQLLEELIPPTDTTGIASMLMDLKNGKKETEIEAINGFICAWGRRCGIATPFNDAIVNIVHEIEAGRMTWCEENLNRLPPVRI